MGIKRLFIGNLTEKITESDLKKEFSNYGVVKSIDIKAQKTNFGINAFMNIDIDDHMLKQCINEFKSEPYQGVYLNINIAKETFLDRLKREREEAALLTTSSTKPVVEPVIRNVPIPELPKLPSLLQGDESSSSDSSEEEEEEKVEIPKPKRSFPISNTSSIKSFNYDPNDVIVKKSSSASMTSSGKIKIELPSSGHSFNAVPMKQEKQLDPKAKEANDKRLESLNKMKQVYDQQKLAIKNALSKVDTKKITFDDNQKQNKPKNKQNKPNLFDGGDDEENYENDFRIREEYQGESGQKLLELQTRFKNDKRFQMGKPFLDNDNNEMEENDEHAFDDDGENNERNWQMGILEGVVGKKLQNNSGNQVPEKTMLRYDPTRKDHTRYLEQNLEKKNKKLEEEKVLDVEEIEVSKETFYKVNDDLSKSLKNKQSFSLLSMFGVNPEKLETEDYKEIAFNSKVDDPGAKKNPFRYDSSDSEYEDNLPKITQSIQHKKKKNTVVQVHRETLFFLKDDARFLEGAELFKNENIIEINHGTLKKVLKRKITKSRNFKTKEKRSKLK